MDGKIPASDGQFDCGGLGVDEAKILRGELLGKQLKRL